MPSPTRTIATAARVDRGEVATTIAEALVAAGSIIAAPLREVAEQLMRVLSPFVAMRALIIFTEDCVGRPQKKAGDTSITENVTMVEMDSLRKRLRKDGTVSKATIGGVERPVVAYEAATGAIIALCDPGPLEAQRESAVRAMWELAATRIRQQAADAAPAQLAESHAVSTERLRVTTELTEQHATDLESILAVLRSGETNDRRARVVATELTTSALVRAKTAGDVVVSISEEPVGAAFRRLRADLRPLTQYGRVDVQFVEPPAAGRALPGEIAHAARSIVRSAVLAMNDQERISRVRVQWDCDGSNLLINIRDDGPGEVDADAPALRQANAKVAALGGDVHLTQVAEWGSELDVRLPLDAAQTAVTHDWGLGRREIQVLRLLMQGKRNRQISQELLISENTVKFHVTQVFRKLGVSSRAAAVAVAAGADLG